MGHPNAYFVIFQKLNSLVKCTSIFTQGFFGSLFFSWLISYPDRPSIGYAEKTNYPRFDNLLFQKL